MITTKQCNICNKIYPISNFYNKAGKCKQCNKEHVKKYRLENIDKIREYDRNRGFRGTHQKVYNKNHNTAKGSCFFCGSRENLEKHHPDYDKPLFIIVLCRKCHRNTHSILNINNISQYTLRINNLKLTPKIDEYKPSSRNKSGVVGVSFHNMSKKWCVQFKGKYIGEYKNKKEAIKMRIKAEYEFAPLKVV